MANFWKCITRTKGVTTSYLRDTELQRSISLLQITNIGLGGCLGMGIYVMSGLIAKEQAGPASCLSFLIAAVASLLAGLCYAELGARIPRSGSTYIYVYVTIGEFSAFLIGWSMILENLLGTATSAKAWSIHLDTMLNGTIRKAIQENIATISIKGLSPYPDLVSFAVVIIATFLLAVGVKIFTPINSLFTLFNILIIASIVFVGLFYVDKSSWTNGLGFFPFGVSGVFSGAATCFYAFMGLDAIASGAEEVKNPGKNILYAATTTTVVAFLAFFSVSSVTTLTVPYFMFYPLEKAPIPEIFEQRGVVGAKLFIAAGSLFGLFSATLCALFPVPRVLMALSRDGLLFNFLSKVGEESGTAWIATILAGIIASLLALIADIHQLTEMLSISLLVAYTMTSICVLLLRFHIQDIGLSMGNYYDVISRETTGLTRENTGLSRETFEVHLDDSIAPTPALEQKTLCISESTGLLKTTNQAKYLESPDNKKQSLLDIVESIPGVMNPIEEGFASKESYQSYHTSGRESIQVFSEFNETYETITRQQSDFVKDSPTDHTSRRVHFLAISLVILFLSLGLTVIFGSEFLHSYQWWGLVLILFLSLSIICVVIFIARQPKNSTRPTFKVPFVPFIPVSSIAINILLLLQLSAAAWTRFGLWLFLGVVLYLAYGLRYSKQRHADDHQELILYDVTDRQNESPEATTSMR